MAPTTTHPPTTQEFDAHTTRSLPSLWGVGTWTRQSAPCNQPCSLMRRDMPTLKQHTHYVSIKADGTRAFMVIAALPRPSGPPIPYVALVGRHGAHRYIKVKAIDDVLHRGTVVDGELIKDKKGGGGGEYFLAFDLIARAGSTTTRMPHSQRQADMRYVINNLHSQQPNLCILPKPWVRYTPTLSYKALCASISPLPCDWVVFVPEKGGLHPGTQRDQLKWKPVAQHTIDLLVTPDMTLWVGKAGSLAKVHHELNIYPHLTGAPDVFQPDQSTIVECSFTRTSASSPWYPSYVRIRLDKKYPNDARIAALTLQNIEENIEITELMQA